MLAAAGLCLATVASAFAPNLAVFVLLQSLVRVLLGAGVLAHAVASVGQGFAPPLLARYLQAALPIYLLGVFASGVLLYGMSYLYGTTGTTKLSEIGDGSGVSVRDLAGTTR